MTGFNSKRASARDKLKEQEMDTELVYLINAVLDQIQKDVHDGDLTAIEEMLAFVPKDKLKGFLPEVTIDE